MTNPEHHSLKGESSWLQRRSTFEYSTQCPVHDQAEVVETGTVTGLLKVSHTGGPSTLYGWFFSSIQKVSPYVRYAQCTAKSSKRTVGRSTDFSLHTALSSVVLCPIKSSSFDILDTTPSSLFRESTRPCLRSSNFPHGLAISSRQ